MSLNATQQWYIRAGGAQTNGGGYDPAVSGAGTNYADQDAPQLSITDLTSTASTTVTSVLSTFTSQMVGNILRLASGTGTTPGYYMITAYVSASQVTLDRASGTYTVGVAKVGGALSLPQHLSNGGSVTAPTIATPLAAGHVINVRGGGTDTPGSADYTQVGYATFPDGNNTSGEVSWIGYNGRPRIDVDGIATYLLQFHKMSTFMVVLNGGTFATTGILNGDGQQTSFNDIVVDQAGFSAVGIHGNTVINCWLKNSGDATADTVPAIRAGNFGGLIQGNFINGWRGYGIDNGSATYGPCASVTYNVVVNCRGTANGSIEVSGSAGTGSLVSHNTLDSGAGDGIKVFLAEGVPASVIRNNTISNFTGGGKYGLNYSVGTLALNMRAAKAPPDYNNFYNNTADRNAISAGAHDTALDPQFTNPGAGDYSIGTNLKAKGFPGPFPGATTTGYLDIGAVQRQEAGGTTVVQVSNVSVFGRGSAVGY